MFNNIKEKTEPLLDIQFLSDINNYNKNFIDSQRLTMLGCYCLVKHLKCNMLSISFYYNNHQNRDDYITFKAKSAAVLCKLISLHSKLASLLSTDHSLYIGMELIKAELAMIAGQSYVQN